MQRRLRYELSVGIFVIVAAIILGYISLKVSRMRVRDGIDVGFLFPHACGLVKDSSVSVAGVEIGYVKDLRLESNKALITASLSSSAKLRKNIRATIRSKSLLGEHYLELIPMGDDAPPLKNGDIVTDTIVPIQSDQMISWMGRLLEEIDPDDAAQLFKVVSRDPAAMGRIIKNADQILAELSSLDAKQLREFIQQLSIKARLF